MSDRQTILVIDNDPGVVRALTVRFESRGYRCLTAATGAEGLAQFLGDDVDLVVSDLSMPSGDGTVLANTLRQLSNVPIIFVTGHEAEYRRRLEMFPNVSVLQKPFDTDQLVALVEAELMLRRPATA